MELRKFSFLYLNILLYACIAVDIIPFCLICKMLFPDHPHLSVDGWEGYVGAEDVAVGMGRPLQGGAGSLVSTDTQVSYIMCHYIRHVAGALPQPGRKHSRLLTSLSPASCLLPELFLCLMAAEGVL